MKLCKDCKWYKKDWITHLIERSDRFDKCLSPAFNQNLVSGDTKGKYCDIQRTYGNFGCGREGKYWEAKE